MDGISGAAAVIGLVQAGIQVTTALGRYISSAKGADSSRAKLLDQIRLISAAETTIETIVRESSPSLRSSELEILIKEWFKEDGTPRKCKRELEELGSWLESQSEARKHRKWFKMASWPAKEGKIQATIRAFEGYMPYFRDVLSMETFNLIQGMVTTHRSDALVTAKLKLLSWLDGFDCTNQHEFTLRQRQQTTGDWLFREQLYTDWRDGSTRFIWLHGKAGAGKSVLASAIIDNISNGLRDNETLAYFYCDFRNNRCTSAMEVLRSVIKQFLWNSKNDWFPPFADLIARKERGARPPTDLDMLSDLLERAVRLHVQPMVFVDALDECEDMSKLLEQLRKLSYGRCRLFVTSRTLHNVKEAFIGLSSISLDDRVDEVRNDMHFHVKTELQSRSRLKALKQDLKDEIEATLLRKADGMFRWVQCQLDRFNGCWSVGDIREVLDTLPRTLYGTYDRMIDAIDRTEFGPRIARRALLWLVLALEPLTLSQLAEVLTIDRNGPFLDVNSAPMHGSDILEVCGSLITFDEESDIVTLSHYSVKEYLVSDGVARSAYVVHRPLGYFELASTSIYSVMLYPHDAPHSSARPFNRFCFYAARNGFKHLASCPPDRNKDLVDLLLSLQDHVSKHRLEYTSSDWKNGSDAWMTEVPQLALYIVTRFGHLPMLRYYLDSHPVRATEEDNPLVYAALYTDLPRFQLLLAKGLDANAEGPIYVSGNVYRMSPLAAAIRNETPDHQEPLAQLLLARSCVVPTYILQSALRCGIGTLCKPAVVRTLLDHGANPSLLIAGGRSPLHLLLGRLVSLSDDDFAIACMLVTAGCDPLALDDNGLSSFHHAIKAGDTGWIQWLLQTGFQLPSDAILHVFQKQYSFVSQAEVPCMVQFLISLGVDVQVRDPAGCNAFHHLVCLLPFIDYNSMVDTIRLLLHRGCDINCQNELGETPLHIIAANHLELGCIEVFVAHGAQLPTDMVNYSVTNHWLSFWEVDCYVTGVLEPLVKICGASCRSVTLSGDNALHCLLRRNALFPNTSCPVARFLLENGCDIRAVSSSGATPLQLAIENGHLFTARLILSWPSVVDSSLLSKLNVVDHNGNGILHRLCIKLRGDWRIEEDEFVDRLTILRETGHDLEKDVNRPNHKGFTPLCIILSVDHHEISRAIPVLLNLGARFSDVTPFYMDGLDWAMDLPWYSEATEAYLLSKSRFKPRFDDVTWIRHLLLLAHLPKIPPRVSKSIMDIAECWAYTKVVRNDIHYTVAYGGIQIAVPATPSNAECHWVPRRVTFSCKPRVVHPNILSNVVIDVRVRRPTATFNVPVYLKPEYSPHYPLIVRTVFDVWDEYTPAMQSNKRGRLAIAELTPRDSFSVEFSDSYGSNDYFELEFFQVEVYYAVDPRRR